MYCENCGKRIFDPRYNNSPTDEACSIECYNELLKLNTYPKRFFKVTEGPKTN